MKDLFFYENLVSLFLKDLRGNVKQNQMSQALGYSFNQWHKWESGEKIINWFEFKKICLFKGVDLKNIVENVFNFKYSLNDKGALFLSEFFKAYGVTDPKKIQKILKLSQATLYRYRSSNKNIPLYLIFQVIGEFSSSLPFFISKILPNPKNEFLKNFISNLNQTMKLEGDYPWISLVEYFLATKDYRQLKRHSHSFVARRLNLSEERVAFAIESLTQLGSIIKKDGIYWNAVKSVNLDVSLLDSARFSYFWTKQCAKRFENSSRIPITKKGFSSRVFPVSKETSVKLQELRKKFLNEQFEIIKDNDNGEYDTLEIFILHHFSLEEFITLKQET